MTGQATGRPNVLALPSPTGSRSLVLLTALISAGLFAGSWVHNTSPVGRDWAEHVATCHEATASVPSTTAGAQLARWEAFQRCTAGVQRRAAAYSLGGAAVAAGSGLLVLLAVPSVIERRRRLRPPGPALEPAATRVRILAGQVGLRRPPRVVVGPATLRDAFSYGLPGSYRVALPRALAIRSGDAALFDPLVRHELEHVARGDVLAAWSARALLWVLLPILGAPVLWGVVRADLSLLPSYLWRAALLGIAGLLAAAAIIRSREHEADIGSARTPEQRDALRALLARIGSGRAGRRRLAAVHPGAADRTRVLDDPARLATVRFVDAATVTFFASIVIPLVIELVSTVASLTSSAYLIAAGLVGPLLGTTLGLGFWRGALARRFDPDPRGQSLAPVALGVVLGAVAGEAASLAQVGSPGVTPPDRLGPAVLFALALCGATMTAAGAAEVFTDIAPMLGRRRSWLAAVAVSSTLFTLAIRTTTTVTSSLELGGWPVARNVLVTLVGSRPPMVAVLVLAATTAVALVLARPGSPIPTWTADEATATRWPLPSTRPRVVETVGCGLAAGTVGALTLIGFRLVAGPADDLATQLQRFDTYIWLFAGSGAAADLALVLVHRRRGLAAGLLAGPVATLVAVTGYLILNSALGGGLTWSLIEVLLRLSLGLHVLLSLGVALMAASPWGRGAEAPRPARPDAAPAGTVILSAVIAFAAAGGCLAARHVLSPASDAASIAPGVADSYRSGFALSMEVRLVALDHAIQRIDADLEASPAVRADRIRRELLVPIQEMQAASDEVSPDAPELRSAHALLRSGLQRAELAFQHFATAWETGDPQGIAEAQAELARATADVSAWRTAVAPGTS